MQSIGKNADHEIRHEVQGRDGVSAEAGVLSGGLVLPRLLRKPVRQVRRLLNGGFHVTRRGLTISAFCFVATALGAGFASRDTGDAVMANLAPSLGIAIKALDISGNGEVSEMEIAAIVAQENASSILGYDVSEARRALKAHPWISDARVSRVYPNKLSIEVTEREAFALWQNEHGLQIIDEEGRVLSEYDGRTHSMPLLVGRGAAGEAASFISVMDRFPAVATQAKAYIMVGERRWDVELDNGITIMLPEEDAVRELSRLEKLDREQELLSRDIDRIDMRIAGRMIVRLSDEADRLIHNKREEQLKVLKAAKKERHT